MRQSCLTKDLRVVRGTDVCESRGIKRKVTPCGGTIEGMVALIGGEGSLAFYAMIAQGSMLRSIAELLVRCAPQVPVTVDGDGLSFVACDAPSGRLVQVLLRAEDLSAFRFMRSHPLRCSLESASLHAVCQQLKRRDAVVLYATANGQFEPGVQPPPADAP